MITADYHVHTDFSGDSTTPMEQMVEQAIHLGLTRICFTDHLDLDFPEQIEAPGQADIFLLDIPHYFHKLEELAHHYKSQIEIRFGIEMGMIQTGYEKYRSLLREYPFDFNIASSHLVDGLDPYFPTYWKQQPSTKAGIEQYLDSTLEHIESFSDFDTYGHLDYIVRYAPDTPSYAYEEYAKKLDLILRRLIESDKALEVNTAGYKYGLGVPNPQPEVLKRYRELGGEKITIGSDGHTTAHLAYDFKRCEELLLSLGYRYYMVFDGHTGSSRKLG